MHAAAEQRVFGHEQHADALLGFIWDAKRGKRERHSCRGSNVRSASALSALSDARQQYGRAVEASRRNKRTARLSIELQGAQSVK